jgi:hypothetical protein
MSNVVLVENISKVFYVTINRPDKLNALSWEVWQELGKAFDEFESKDRLTPFDAQEYQSTYLEIYARVRATDDAEMAALLRSLRVHGQGTDK